MSSGSAVLIVDDQRNLRETLADILRSRGYQVQVADCGLAALDWCGRERFDTVLLDVRMPDINGVDVFRELAARGSRARVVLMSAYADEALKIDLLNEGAAAFLDKPLNIETLMKLLSGARETAVLIVEHDAALADALRERLEDEGYWVRTSADAEEALRLTEQIRFDIIVVDADLPEMDGLDIYHRIQTRAPGAAAVVLADRGRESEALVAEALRRCAFGVIRKPADVDEVAWTLDQIVARRASRTIEPAKRRHGGAELQ